LKGTRAKRLRLAIEELGPTFIKFGQLLSVRADILPKELISELTKLQDEVNPLPFDEIKKVVEKELKNPISTLYGSFTHKPEASASLAQVHRAVTKEDKTVVVKVQRPGVREIIETDLSIMELLANLIEREIRGARDYELVTRVQEIGKNLLAELNFANEGRAIDRFRTNFKDDDDILIPEVYWELTTDKVLTMERLEGMKITNVEALDRAGLSRKEFTEKGANFILRQVFDFGYFHADPHPGNMLVSKDGKIILLDFGLIGSLDDEMVENLANLVTAVVKRDIERITELFVKLGVMKEDVDIRGVKSDLFDFIDRYYGIPLSRLSVNEIVNDIFETSRKYRMKIPRNLILLAKALSTVEGIAHQLDPDFNMIAHLKPFTKKIIERKYSLKNILREASRIVESYSILLRKLPGDITLILKNIKDGKLKIEFEHRGLKNFISKSERSANRLSFSFIIAALIVGSSLIMLSNKGPFLLGFPALGIIGFVIAGIFGLGLVISLLRSGKL
ncbi:AarF/ABC1/UbiB kinase family protein, partial [candidate division WOR-3 bacterium]|nr:AarF/ABC1/UbiB kinase family protein [candidate division WOR-3 bacterium]